MKNISVFKYQLRHSVSSLCCLTGLLAFIAFLTAPGNLLAAEVMLYAPKHGSSDKVAIVQNRSKLFGTQQQIPATIVKSSDTSWPVLQERLLADEGLACRISYQQTAAALKTMPPQASASHLPPITLAPYDVFIKDCSALPVMVQRCQVFEYMWHHPVECTGARRAYDRKAQTMAARRYLGEKPVKPTAH